VLFASIHQSGIYPGSGPLSDVGSGAGEGYTINLPVPAGSQEELWLSLLEHVVIPAARAFEPDLVLVSAGFDAHRADPLADCGLESASFARMARAVRELAALRTDRAGRQRARDARRAGGRPAGRVGCARAAADRARGGACRPVLAGLSRSLRGPGETAGSGR
jgi:hypothetical protein